MLEKEPRFIKMYDIFSGDLFQKEKYTLVIPINIDSYLFIQGQFAIYGTFA